jgi:putative transposase
MSRRRFEAEQGVYHVINRGNYRAHVFQSDRTKTALLKCLDETCQRTGWQIHAWCIMSNHFHLAMTTPQANLADGMRWFQGTFANRFNRLRQERGHLFQGRYKNGVIDPGRGLGSVCHYIHLNPVRAHLCEGDTLAEYPWTSLRWLFRPSQRPLWYQPGPALAHAGELPDQPAGWRKYVDYLKWLAEDEPERKAQRFEAMSHSWIIGGPEFTKTVLRAHEELKGQGPRAAEELSAARQLIWTDMMKLLLKRLHRTPAELVSAGKCAPWKSEPTRQTIAGRRPVCQPRGYC